GLRLLGGLVRCLFGAALGRRRFLRLQRPGLVGDLLLLGLQLLGGLLIRLGIGRGLLRLGEQILLALRQFGGLLVGRLLARQSLTQPLQLALGLLLRRGQILLVLRAQILKRLRRRLLGLLAARLLIGRVELRKVVGQLRLLLGQLGQLLVAVA